MVCNFVCTKGTKVDQNELGWSLYLKDVALSFDIVYDHVEYDEMEFKSTDRDKMREGE